MIIASTKLNNNLMLAPVAGISSLPFRLIAKEFGAGICFTEMVSSEALVRNNTKTYDLLKTHPSEKPLGAQIFGSKPQIMAKAASILENRGFDIIDINAGCPVKKVTKNQSGAALIKNPHLLRQILMEVRKNISIPLMLKCRSGWDSHSINAVEIAKIAEDCGVDAITLHPRTAAQMFDGKADWGLIRQVKKTVNIPVIGNGDVCSPDRAAIMMKETGCDGVMIGRGAFGNPWIFKNILRHLNREGLIKKPLAEERGRILLKHLDYCIEVAGETKAIRNMRKHYSWYAKNLPSAARFRNTIFQKNSKEDVKQEIQKFFFNPLVQN
jgi:tRNA-dihydrouridine synthase B